MDPPMNGLPSTMPTTPLLLKSLFNRGSSIQPDNLIIEKTSNGYSTQTYTQHLHQSKALALALTANDPLTSPRIQRGDRVATFSFNTNRHLTCYHAVPLIGAVLHPINIRLGPKEIGYILGHAGDAVAIVDATLLDSFSKVGTQDLNQHLRLIVVCGENDTANGWQRSSSAKVLRRKFHNVIDWDEFLAPHHHNSGAYTFPEDIPEHSASGMCYTSGTTGNPKGVLYSHRSTYLHTLAMPSKDNHNLGGADVLLPVVPYFHANGWGIPYVALMLGARILHNSKFTDSTTILQMAVDWGATYSAAVPAIWQDAKQTLEKNMTKYITRFKIENIICGGSAPPPAMMAWYKKQFNVDFMQGWGMTETSPMGTFGKYITRYEHQAMAVADRFDNIKVAGLSSPGVELKIVDSNDFSKQLPNDGVSAGELLVRGPWVTAKYYNISKPEAFVNGWLATGDVASITGNGDLIIRDRSKDVIKSGGEWISSIDLEKLIAGIPSVQQVAVVAQPHPKWDERPVCVIVPIENADATTLTTKYIRQHCSEHFAKYELPDEVLLWQALPMTGTGKVDKKNIRKRLSEEKYVLPSLRGMSKL